MLNFSSAVHFPSGVEPALIRDVAGAGLQGNLRHVCSSSQEPAAARAGTDSVRRGRDCDKFRETASPWERGDGAYWRGSYHHASSGMAPVSAGTSAGANEAADTGGSARAERGSSPGKLAADKAPRMAGRRQTCMPCWISRLLVLPQYLWNSVRRCFGGTAPHRTAVGDGLLCAQALLPKPLATDGGCQRWPALESLTPGSSDSGIGLSATLPVQTCREAAYCFDNAGAGEAEHRLDSRLSGFAGRQQQHAIPPRMAKAEGNQVPVSEFAVNPPDCLLSRFAERQRRHARPACMATAEGNQVPVSEFAVNPPDCLLSRFAERQRRHARPAHMATAKGNQVPVSEFAVNPPDCLLSRFAERQRRQQVHHGGSRIESSKPRTADRPAQFQMYLYPPQHADIGEIVKIKLWANQECYAPPASLRSPRMRSFQSAWY